MKRNMKAVHVEIYTYYFLKGQLNCDGIGCMISDFVFIDKVKEKLVGLNTLIKTLKVFKDDMHEWYIEIPNLKEDEDRIYIDIEMEVL